MPRFSLKTLLIAAAVVPVAVYALAVANPFVASVAIIVTLLAWIAMILAWIECVGESRAFARGWVLAMTIYLTAEFWAIPKFTQGAVLVSTSILTLADGLLGPRSQGYEWFYYVGESWLCLLVGLAGGWFAGWLYRRRQNADKPNTAPSNTQ
jgi:hypothetical protein